MKNSWPASEELIRLRRTTHKRHVGACALGVLFGVGNHTVMLPSGREVRVPIRIKVNGLSCDVQIRLFRLLQMPERKFGDKVNSSSGTGLLLLEASDGMPASRAHSPAVFIMQLKIVLRSWMKTRR